MARYHTVSGVVTRCTGLDCDRCRNAARVPRPLDENGLTRRSPLAPPSTPGTVPWEVRQARAAERARARAAEWEAANRDRPAPLWLRVMRGDFHVEMPDVTHRVRLDDDYAQARRLSAHIWGRKWARKPITSQVVTYASDKGSRRSVGNAPPSLVPREHRAAASLMTRKPFQE